MNLFSNRSVVEHLVERSSLETAKALKLSGPEANADAIEVLQRCFENDARGLSVAIEIFISHADDPVAVGSLLSEVLSFRQDGRIEILLSVMSWKKWGLREEASESEVLSAWLRCYLEHFIDLGNVGLSN